MSTVYVDQLFCAVARGQQAFKVGQRNGHMWCHLFGDDVEALHALAQKIGMRRSWFQNKNKKFPHYDLTPSRRKLAIKHGAIERSLMDYLREKRDF